VGYNGRCFFPLWDTTEEFFSVVGYNRRVFFRCGIQRRFSSFVGYNRRRFFLRGIQRRKISGWLTIFFPVYPTTLEFFFRCILQHNRILCGVLYPTIQHRRIVGSNTKKSSALYPTTPQDFLSCIPQWKIFSSVVGYNGRVFFHCGIQRKRFFSIVGYSGICFFRCGIQWKRFFSIVGYNGEK
jgi:hypothetical protein